MREMLKLIELPTIKDSRGNLSFAEIEKHIPFSIGQISWSQKENIVKQKECFIINLMGELNISDDENSICLTQALHALYLPHTAQVEIKFNSESKFLTIYPNGGASYTEGSISSMGNQTVYDSRILEFPQNKTEDLPFQIRRIFHVYDVPHETMRGDHANIDCHEILVAIAGEFDVSLNDGLNQKTIRLDNPQTGLHIPPNIWASQTNYSNDAICLVLASKEYNKEGYINNFDDFLTHKQQ